MEGRGAARVGADTEADADVGAGVGASRRGWCSARVELSGHVAGGLAGSGVRGLTGAGAGPGGLAEARAGARVGRRGRGRRGAGAWLVAKAGVVGGETWRTHW